jgi:hypothetical protein
MAEYCPNCFEKLDALHICESSESSTQDRSSGSSIWETNQSLAPVVIAAPLFGFLLDFVLPFPSSLVHSLLISVVGSGIVAAIWVAVKYEGQKSLKFFAFNVKNFLYTPNILKVFGSYGVKKATPYWFAVVFLSAALQMVIFTPGNATYLGNQVSKKIDSASGANLKVECPSTKFYLYNEKIECRVKTGILGISVPARATVSPLIGTADIKVSIL